MQGTLWTEEEMNVVTNFNLTDKEAAERIGRPVKSVYMKRWHIKNEGVARHTANSVNRSLRVTPKAGTLGSRIQQLRLKKNITREDLGLAVGYGSKKSARNNIGQFETGARVPTEEKVRLLAEYFGVTKEYLLTGKEEEKKVEVKPVSEMPDPQPLKTAMSNHEGYNDPTAAKAVAIVMNTKKSSSFGDKVLPKHDPKPGEVYEVLNCSTHLLVLGVSGENVLMTNLLPYSLKNTINTTKVKVPYERREIEYTVNLTKVFTRKTTDLIDKTGNISENEFHYILDQYSKNFGFGEIKVKEPTKADPMSLRFADSMDYFNEKNGTDFKAPEGVITLQMAVDISKKMSIDLTELVKDHKEDRVMDEIIKLQERIKELEASIGLNN